MCCTQTHPMYYISFSRNYWLFFYDSAAPIWSMRKRWMIYDAGSA
jgi:hypothetical protein